MFLNTFNPEFSYIKVWFTDQNFKQIMREDRVNLTLLVYSYKEKWDIYLNLEITKSVIGKYSKNPFDITKKYATYALKLHEKSN